MPFDGQPVLPAVRKVKDFEKLMKLPHTYIILLDCHISQLSQLVGMAKANSKKVLLHADLIEGLKNDEYAAEYLCQVIKPEGIISTRSGVITKTKQNGLLAIQRLFLLDTNALEKSYVLLERTRPDFIEVLPGVIPHIIAEVLQRTGIPIIAGGLIRSAEDVTQALRAGASAVTSSNLGLWNHQFS
ncbi:glycerol-3-phosphate responsive antiterminator GlpP [Paenibacillus sambharensis]|uniref:Glycerol uptake operon antiterminator regulatory protein n=1 Tax=Paenibacillus sambharensis TaxID=1803190 RepID=A0A2W1LX04_9BACL|nr:glycerol-3-phosphate responsive antiterminator [Paenibacillus sambharensis]PZD96301.1 glycerol-3-phosphate responsive antiterminator GlpP [Paenibacillus sambharensis]